MGTNFYIVSAMYDENTFFLFRDYAIEIKFTIINGIVKVVGMNYFLPEELLFIKENYL
jgi:hypothetical protein